MSIVERTPTDRIVVRTERRLHLDEVDAFGIVFYARYWEWYQHTFEAFLRELGHPLEGLFAEGYGFPVAHADIDYRTMLRLGQIVRCEMWGAAVGQRSVTMNARFSNEAGAELARAKTVHVAVGSDGSPQTVPDWLRDAAAISAASTA